MLTDEQLARIAALQNKYTSELMLKKHVVGVSVGPVPDVGSEPIGGWGLVVLVDQLEDPADLDPQDRIPSHLEGIPVTVRVVGKIKAL
jgi:hypothetical protein